MPMPPLQMDVEGLPYCIRATLGALIIAFSVVMMITFINSFRS